MIIDYKTQKLTFGKQLPAEPSDFELPLRLLPAGDGPRHGGRQAPGELRRRYRRRSDLDQRGDGQRARQAGVRAAGSR